MYINIINIVSVINKILTIVNTYYIFFKLCVEYYYFFVYTLKKKVFVMLIRKQLSLRQVASGNY